MQLKVNDDKNVYENWKDFCRSLVFLVISPRSIKKQVKFPNRIE